MKVNFSAIIKTLDGDPIKDGTKDMTLANVSAGALLAPYQDEQNLSGEDKVKRFRLAEKLYPGGEIEISVEDAALLKRLIAKGFTTLVTARAFDIIEAGAEK